jgi:hypothetical protein
MKKLVYAAVVASAFAASACVVEENPVIIADITLSSAGGGQITFQPDDGLRVNARLSGTSSGFSDIYPPNVVALQTPELTTGYGLYDIWVDYINDGRGEVVIVDTTNIVTVDVQEDLHVDADLVLGNGFFIANWTFNGGANTCADYAATSDGVSILATVTGGTDAFDDVFNCEDGAGMNPAVTAPTPVDSYTISAALIDSQGLAIGTAPDLPNQRIAEGNDYTDLGVLDIAVP